MIPGCGDVEKELSGGYSYSLEGSTRFIGHPTQLTTGKIIPCEVIDYEYNDEFIIASQDPVSFADCPRPYNREDAINSGNDINYWIADHRSDALLGPLSLEEYKEKRAELGIPEDLQLEDEGS